MRTAEDQPRYEGANQGHEEGQPRHDADHGQTTPAARRRAMRPGVAAPDPEKAPGPAAADAQPSDPRSRSGASSGDAPPGAGHERPEGAGAALASMLGAATAPMRAVARPLGRGVGRIAEGAQRSIREGSGARVRSVRRRGRQPLVNLFVEHPRAYQATRRDLGLRTIPVEQVRGTGVEGPTQRGGDFLPLRQLRGQDWQNRWQRIRSALDSLVDLPPVDVLKFGDEYWVMDGHNRLAAALYNGQVAIDANVTELAVPGIATEPPHPMAAYLQGSRDLRAAGEGTFSRTATLPEDRERLPDAIAVGDEAAELGPRSPGPPGTAGGAEDRPGS